MQTVWPHSAYAEDQRLARTILSTHVLHRGFQSGALVGSAVGAGRWALARWRTGAAAGIAPALLRPVGFGAAVGTGLMIVGLPARMWGREEIEWQDRSWRLLENEGQVQVDRWSVAGSLAGAATAAWRAPAVRSFGWRGWAGAVGLGNLAGVAGYMVWRYGIKRGARQE